MRAVSNHTQRGIRHSVLARTGQRQSAAHRAALPTLCLAPGAMQEDPSALGLDGCGRVQGSSIVAARSIARLVPEPSW